MSGTRRTTTFGRMGSGEVINISARRRRIGLSVSALAKRAGIDRNQLAAIEKGESQPRDTTLDKIVAALAALEEEMGIDDEESPPTESGLVSFEIDGVYGAKRVVVSGPVENLDELRATVERLLKGNPLT